MSPMLCSQGMVLATAMAVSGTVILLALRLQKSLPPSLFPIEHLPPHHQQQQQLRSCISSEGKKKKKKKVHFAEDVVDPRGDSKDFRRQHGTIVFSKNSSSSCSSNSATKFKKSVVNAKEIKGMPANRAALYNGILRDRVVHRFTYSC